MIVLDHLSFSFPQLPLFKDLQIRLGEENPTAILGPSGCGKTTLLRLCAGLLPPTEAGPLFQAQGGAFVFQDNRLLPWLTVLQNVILPSRRLLGEEEAKRRGRENLARFAMEDKEDAYPRELSGGQKQRVSIARACTYPSDYIYLDEAFQSLDIPLRVELMETLRSLLRSSGRRLIAVTHDPREAVFLAERIIILGRAPRGIIFDEPNPLSPPERIYGSESHARFEARLLRFLAPCAAGEKAL